VQTAAAGTLAFAGMVCAALAVWHERRMQRHRRPDVTYAAATLRRDGGWRRTDLFTDEGLRHQARASRYGMAAAAWWVLALAAWVVFGL
jgi:ABC-type Fe3+ transport system permease subunit